jgi:hypothetical protein
MFPSIEKRSQAGLALVLSGDGRVKSQERELTNRFDSHALPPYPSDLTEVAEKRGGNEAIRLIFPVPGERE